MTRRIGFIGLAALPVALVLTLSTNKLRSVSADDERSGQLHITKDCATAGGYCTIQTSNLAEIKPKSKVFYDQSPGVPPGYLDSNVLLDVGTGDWAVGRCTLDLSTGLGLCTFSDGKGPLAGFSARVNVTPLGGTLFAWDGTYSFRSRED